MYDKVHSLKIERIYIVANFIKSLCDESKAGCVKWH
ncbi:MULTISPECIES: hypothetical protein [unclassified Sphingobacterium]